MILFLIRQKKFNADGPDGLTSSWHDLRKGKEGIRKQHSDGECLMAKDIFW